MISTTLGKGIASVIASSTSSSPVGEDIGANPGTIVTGANQTSTGSVNVSSSSSTSMGWGMSSPAAATTSAAAGVTLGSSLAAWTALFMILGLVLV